MSGTIDGIAHCDYLITNGTVYDGFGGEGIRADVAIRDDTVIAVGPYLATQMRANVTLDATKRAVAPGFIDIHTHSDFTVLMNPQMESSIHQGVTTELFGNCGISIGLLGDGSAFTQERRWADRGGIVIDWDDLCAFYARIEARGVAINVGSLAGHGTIRKRVLEFAERAPDASELAQMQHLVAGVMQHGAFGLSTGLEYLPGGHAKPEEIAELAAVARDAGGFYATHLRNEGDTLVESIREAFAVTELAGIPTQLSHHKAEGRKNWGIVQTTLQMMRDARARGWDVLTDQYPYTAYMTGLAVIVLPGWANSGGPEEVTARLRDPETRARIVADVSADPPDWSAVQIGIARNHRDAQGLTITALAAREGKSPIDAALDLLRAEEGFLAAAHFAMSEEDVEAVLRDPHTMIGSDGVASSTTGPLSEDKTHPRTYGTFPRVLGLYSREKGVLTLGEAIRRMTSLPAQRLNLTDRGRLTVGAKADIVVFDPLTVDDTASYDEPHQFAGGIDHVFVNGRLALRDGAQTETLAGRVLRRT